MTHVKLKLEDDFYLLDTTVFGLISELPPYRLCYFLNLHFHSRFCRAEQDKRIAHKAGPLDFPTYFWQDEAADLDWTMVKNKVSSPGTAAVADLFSETVEGQVALLERQRKFDYILYYQGEDSPRYAMETLQKLKNMHFITNVQWIDTRRNPQSFNILFI